MIESGASILVDRALTLKAAAWKVGLYSNANYTIFVNSMPKNISLIPNSGAFANNMPIIFTSVYTDPAGFGDLSRCYLLINNKLSTLCSVCVKYDAVTNSLYIRDEKDTTWLGGFAPGSQNVIQNKYFTLYCAGTSVVWTANDLKINWRIQFKPIIDGSACSDWMSVVDKWEHSTAWTKMGNQTTRTVKETLCKMV